MFRGGEVGHSQLPRHQAREEEVADLGEGAGFKFISDNPVDQGDLAKPSDGIVRRAYRHGGFQVTPLDVAIVVAFEAAMIWTSSK